MIVDELSIGSSKNILDLWWQSSNMFHHLDRYESANDVLSFVKCKMSKKSSEVLQSCAVSSFPRKMHKVPSVFFLFLSQPIQITQQASYWLHEKTISRAVTKHILRVTSGPTAWPYTHPNSQGVSILCLLWKACQETFMELHLFTPFSFSFSCPEWRHSVVSSIRHSLYSFHFSNISCSC